MTDETTPPRLPLFSATSLEEAVRVLLAVLPIPYTGVVLVDADVADANSPGDAPQHQDAVSIYSKLGHQVGGIRDLALHFWAEARRDQKTNRYDVFHMTERAKKYILENFDAVNIAPPPAPVKQQKI